VRSSFTSTRKGFVCGAEGRTTSFCEVLELRCAFGELPEAAFSLVVKVGLELVLGSEDSRAERERRRDEEDDLEGFEELFCLDIDYLVGWCRLEFVLLSAVQRLE
jgi:hypothetical protein